MRILVADQESVDRSLLKAICRGHRINEAKHSTEALRLGDKVDLIFTDIGFPGLAGKEYITALKRRTMAKIIIVTAYTDYEDTRVDHIFYKPINRKQITEIINSYDKTKTSARTDEK